MTQVDPTWIRPEAGWVCTECGFDFDATEPATTPDVIRAFGRRYRAPLSRGLPGEDLDALLRARPPEGGWSALEYACHVRDALGVYQYRIGKVLDQERPEFRAMNRDEAARDQNYNGSDPAAVGEQLEAAAAALADRIAGVPVDGWERVGLRDGFEMRVDWMARNAVHEGVHHLLDVGRVLRSARGR